MAHVRRAVWLVTVLTLCGSLRAAAQTGENVLVVANGNSPASLEIADYYSAKRKVPADHIVRVAAPVAEEIARSTYDAQIERPIAQWLIAHSAQDRILYIVITKGVPLRVSGTSGPSGTVASVDSELTLLYRKLSGHAVALAGSIPNPYFLGKAAIGNAKPLTRRQHDLYLVARLDGYTVADVKGLIDRGLAPSQEGRILLDARAELKSSPGNTWLTDAANAVRKLPGWSTRVVLDT